MRIATWNVNSLRTRIDRVEALLDRHEIDVLALQETKAREEQLPLMGLQARGYEIAAAGTNQWNGVAILSRVGLEDVQIGFPGQPGFTKDLDTPAEAESRAIGATCGGVRLWSLYVPNGRKPDDPHYAYKLEWYAALREAARDWLGADSVLVGDWNVCPTDDDVFDVTQFKNSTHVTPGRARGLLRLRRGRLGRHGQAVRRRLHLLGLLPAALRAQPRPAHRLPARLAVAGGPGDRRLRRPRRARPGPGHRRALRPRAGDRRPRLTEGRRGESTARILLV